MSKSTETRNETQTESKLEEWKYISWKKSERYISKLQQRIYSASLKNNLKLVRKLQHTLLQSRHAKLIAVRRVTQDNKGKKTAGIDGILVLNSKDRLSLVNKIKVGNKATAVRRIWIPKLGSDEKRPLGIPTIEDRAVQALVKMALEPEWEARFEPNSYGFRPGRCCHDAIKQIKVNIQRRSKYVLDADITKCFDQINHKALLDKIGVKGILYTQIRAWLKAGVLNNFEFTELDKGTPQGGVISPLLANIALHGMEEVVNQFIVNTPLRNKRGIAIGKREKLRSISLIRYADDFIVMHENKQIVEECRNLLTAHLSLMGLELKPAKTRLSHTLHSALSEDNIAGFDFLGFTIRQFRTKFFSALENGTPLGLRTIILPSKKSCLKHQLDIKCQIDTSRNFSQKLLIQKLNPCILGWSRYFSISNGLRVFSKQDFLTYLKIRRWAKMKKGNISSGSDFWTSDGTRKWVFKPKDNSIKLAFHTNISCSVNSYVKVKGNASPYDSNHSYWSLRLRKDPQVSPNIAKLLVKQLGKCAHCDLSFRNFDVLEIDHIIPKSQGGKDEYKNLRLLHRHCHDTVTNEQFKVF